LVLYKKGMVYDDIIMEENPEMQEALRRLPSNHVYDRHFRHKYAIQLSILKNVLPKDQQTTDAQVSLFFFLLSLVLS